MSKIKFLAILGCIWYLASCDEFCEESNRTAMVVNFYSSTSGTAQAATKLSIQGLGNDSLYTTQDLSSALCPLNPGSDATTFLFSKLVENAKVVDTVTITYSRHPGFISSECGCVTYSEIQEIKTTNHSISSISITNPSVSTVSYRPQVINGENIRIYY